METEDRLHLSEQPFALGDYDVDPKALRIKRSGEGVKVEFKVQVVLVLAHSAGEVVSRRTFWA
jgi:DNA-binding winged helix-turn-helix (wHTH) protein